MHHNYFSFGVFLWFLITIISFSLFNKKTTRKDSREQEQDIMQLAQQYQRLKEESLQQTINFRELTLEKEEEIIELRQQYHRLKDEVEDQLLQQIIDFKKLTFSALKSLLTSYPTACKMVKTKPDLPAKNLTELFTPLDNLMKSWGYETIGQPWEKVIYNPQFHQADSDGIKEGEWVYVRFIGYQDGERVIFPAKVSLTLPIGVPV